VFFLVGLPGIPLALLVRMTVRELPRGFSESIPADDATVGIGEVIRFLLSRRSFVLIASGASCQSLGGYAVLSWGPAFLERVHQMGAVEIGAWLGLSVGVGGSAGAYLGGKLADHLGARDVRWYMRLPSIQALLGIPFVAGFLMFGNPRLALLSFFPFYFIANMYIGPMLSMTQGLVKLRMRATASAILLFILNMVGLGAGSFLVGFLNDQLAGRFGIESIRYSLLAVALVGGMASLFFLQASRTLANDLRAREG
jgi:predicted MFS family arabinose efflux permease